MRAAGSRSQQGFTLVELMIALVLGLLVVVGVSQVYLMTLQSSRAIADVAARQEVVSYFTHVVGNEARSSNKLYPVENNDVDPVDNSAYLQMNFEEDASDPPFSDMYCPSADSLSALVYFAEDGYLKVAPYCVGAGDISGGGEKVVSGVEDIIFDRGVVGGVADRFVDVTLTLSSSDNTFSNATAAKNTIEMRLVSHSVSIFD